LAQAFALTQNIWLLAISPTHFEEQISTSHPEQP